LLQAEAVADLIDAGSAQAARAAQATLRGEFSQRVSKLSAALTAIRVQIEAGFDFSEEELGDRHLQTLTTDLHDLANGLDELIERATRGVQLRDGLRVVLVGAPNVGKSSVLNRLAGEERAIVTAVPGTTRDVIRESIRLGGTTIELMDTAGLHESADAVEKIGMAQTVDKARNADLVLLVCDDRDRCAVQQDLVETDGDVLLLFNKIDLTVTKAGPCCGGVALSARTGAGFEALHAELVRRSSFVDMGGEFSARQRHLDCLGEARDHLRHAMDVAAAGLEIELSAEDLRQCQIALGRITGVVTSDDLLGEIFASFCIGK
jgi:tRNA modification GTPase